MIEMVNIFAVHGEICRGVNLLTMMLALALMFLLYIVSKISVVCGY